MSFVQDLLTTHRREGGTGRTTLDSAGELRDALTDIFRLWLPEAAESLRLTSGAVQ